ncbi:MAG: FecR domain-containing protein [Caenispirillum sp.]|nr:FecR domain-containing protein [Caenispirillum sp.]
MGIMRADAAAAGFDGIDTDGLTVIDGHGGEGLAIADAGLLLTGRYVRLGPDLLIRGADGQGVLITDYFTHQTAPTLAGPAGLQLDGPLVTALAGPRAPAQVAQASVDGAQLAQGAEAIGTVTKLTGIVFAQRADGTRVQLASGDQVFQGDIIETGSDGAVGVTFVDNTEMSLGSSGRLVLDEMIYDPDSGSGESSFSLVSGAFSFVSGQIAKSGPDAMTVKTPVATIGIRGTKGVVKVGAFDTDGDGEVDSQIEVALLDSGEIVVRAFNGVTQTINQVNTGFRIVQFSGGDFSSDDGQQGEVSEFTVTAEFFSDASIRSSLSQLPQGTVPSFDDAIQGEAPDEQDPATDPDPEGEAEGPDPTQEAAASVVRTVLRSNELRAAVGLPPAPPGSDTGTESLPPNLQALLTEAVADLIAGAGDDADIEDALDIALGELLGPDDGLGNDDDDLGFGDDDLDDDDLIGQLPDDGFGDDDGLGDDDGFGDDDLGGDTGDDDLGDDDLTDGDDGLDDDAGGGGSGGGGSDTHSPTDPFAGFTQTTLTGGAADYSTATTPQALFGSSSSDSVTGGSAGDYLDGGGGDDSLIGGEGNDTVYGGSGGDSVVGGSGAGYDDYYGGSSTTDDSADDWLIYTSAVSGVTVTLTDGYGTNFGTAYGADIDYDTLLGFEHVRSGTGNDSLFGNGAANTLDAGAGNDSLVGFGGNDSLGGGLGDDTYGYWDTVTPWSSDTIDDAGGADVIDFSGGMDNEPTSVYRSGRNLVFETAGRGSITALNHFDTDSVSPGYGQIEYIRVDDDEDVPVALAVTVNAGTDTVLSGSGLLVDGDNASLITGDSGVDGLFGNGGDDTLNGGLYDDMSDFMAGGLGNDVYRFQASIGGVGTGSDSIYEVGDSSGIDRIEITGFQYGITGGNTDGDKLILQLDGTYSTESTIDVEGDVEQFKHNGIIYSILLARDSDSDSGYSDLMVGTRGNDVLNIGAGVDIVTGGDGNDTITSSELSRSVLVTITETQTANVGQEQITTIDFSGVPLDGDLVRLVIDGTPVTATFYGTSGDMPGFISDVHAAIAAAAPSLTLNSSGSTITLTGSIGIPFTITEGPGGWGSGGDRLLGGGGDDSITGSAASDHISGDDADDTLIGGLGNDTLWGGDGHDSLVGGDGVDSLSGGSGDDTLVGDSTDEVYGGEGDDVVIWQEFGTISGGAGIDFIGLRDQVASYSMANFNSMASAAAFTFSGKGFEGVALDDDGAMAFAINATDLSAASLTEIYITGDGNDTVSTTDGDWAFYGVVTTGRHSYLKFENTASQKIFIEGGITRTGFAALPTTPQWIGPYEGLWSDGSNWGSQPGPADNPTISGAQVQYDEGSIGPTYSTVNLDAMAGLEVVAGSHLKASIFGGDGTGMVHLNGGQISLSAGGSVLDSLDVSAGTLTLGGSMTITNGLSITGGSIAGSGTITLDGAAASLDGVSLSNSSLNLWMDGAATVITDGSSTLGNISGDTESYSASLSVTAETAATSLTARYVNLIELSLRPTAGDITLSLTNTGYTSRFSYLTVGDEYGGDTGAVTVNTAHDIQLRLSMDDDSTMAIYNDTTLNLSNGAFLDLSQAFGNAPGPYFVPAVTVGSGATLDINGGGVAIAAGWSGFDGGGTVDLSDAAAFLQVEAGSSTSMSMLSFSGSAVTGLHRIVLDPSANVGLAAVTGGSIAHMMDAETDLVIDGQVGDSVQLVNFSGPEWSLTTSSFSGYTAYENINGKTIHIDSDITINVANGL